MLVIIPHKPGLSSQPETYGQLLLGKVHVHALGLSNLGKQYFKY